MLDKASMVAGITPLTWSDVLSVYGSSGIAPVRMLGTSAVTFFASKDGPCGFKIWGLTGGLVGLPSVTMQDVALTGDCNSPRYPPQLGGPDFDIATGPSARAPVYRNGRLFVAATWQQGQVGVASGVSSAIRWAEINVSNWPNAPTVIQDGTIGSDGVWYFFPAINVDASGNMVISFNTSGTTSYASIAAAVRLSTDASGTTRAPTLVKAGTAPMLTYDPAGRNRFADWSSIAVDPVTGGTWIHAQFAAPPPYQTWVAQIRP